ncbi:MAG TPA: DNA-binding protein [Ignavibacteria bacterium]|nr:DNA-binding protein [Ignavibacteria bacterium]HRJ99044.1 DNA-binding protein [Ignavibacteria bacterium]
MKLLKINLIIALVLFFAGNIYPQNGWGPGSKYNRMYDVNTVETINGMVISIDQISHGNRMSNGIHLQLSTKSGNITVHLGPSWYIDNQDVLINKNDDVTVTGSRVNYEGEMVIIAKELIKGDQILTLRDDKGYPYWAGWRKRN